MDENFFVSGHDYEIEIFLELPESSVNRELGMFMVGIELFTEDGYEVGSISKPVTNFFFKKKSFIISIPDKIKIQIRLVSFPSCFISYDSINIWVLGRNSIHSINSLRSFGKKEWLLFFFLKTQLLFFKKKNEGFAKARIFISKPTIEIYSAQLQITTNLRGIRFSL